MLYISNTFELRINKITNKYLSQNGIMNRCKSMKLRLKDNIIKTICLILLNTKKDDMKIALHKLIINKEGGHIMHSGSDNYELEKVGEEEGEYDTDSNSYYDYMDQNSQAELSGDDDGVQYVTMPKIEEREDENIDYSELHSPSITRQVSHKREGLNLIVGSNFGSDFFDLKLSQIQTKSGEERYIDSNGFNFTNCDSGIVYKAYFT